MPGGGGLHARHAGPPRRVGGGNKAGIEASAKISRFPARERACLPAAQIAAASAGHLSPRFAQSLRAPQLQPPQGLENSALRLSPARTLDTAAVVLCDLSLGLSLSGLLYNNRAPDADIPRPPQSFQAPGTGATHGGWGAGCFPALELAFWSEL